MSAVGKVCQRVTRSFTTTAARKSEHHGPEGFPGANLPFSIQNRYTLTALFTAFIGSAFSLPFIIVRYQLTR